MGTWANMAKLASEAVAETLWPTRCALCDAPGSVLCPECAATLPVLDMWKACPRCGSAFGKIQCDLCNPVSLGRIGRERLPFEGCASATMFDEDTTGSLVRVYKDQGERRLVHELAERMARVVPPSWDIDAVTFIPATKAAVRYRGFDHAELLGREVATRIGVPCTGTLDRPRTRDQRTLGSRERIENLGGGFRAPEGAVKGAGRESLLLVDDVFTTGSTLCAATDALLAAGAARVWCLTFARV